MNKEELVSAIVENTKFTKVDTKKFLDSYIDLETTALKYGNIVQLIGFGNFSVIDKPERKGRNPRSGEEITIAASKAVKFAAGKLLKDAVNQ